MAPLRAERDTELAAKFRIVGAQGHRARERGGRRRILAGCAERQTLARVKLGIVGPQRDRVGPGPGLVAPPALSLVGRREHAIRRDPVGAQAHGLAERPHRLVGAPQAFQGDAEMVVGFGGRGIDGDRVAQRAHRFR